MMDLSYRIAEGVYTINSTFNSTSTQFNVWEGKLPVWAWIIGGIDIAFLIYFLYNYKKQRKRETEEIKKESELERNLLK